MGVIQRQGIRSAIITYCGILIGFVSLLLVQPHFLRPEEIGLTRVLFSCAYLVSTVLPLSITGITIRYFPRFRNEPNGHNGYFGLMLLWLLAGVLLCFPVLLLAGNFIKGLYIDKSPLFASYFYWVFPLSLTIALITVISNYLFSVFRPLIPSLLQDVGIRVFFITLIFIYYFGWIDLRQFITGFILTYLFQLVLLLLYASRVGSVSFRINREKATKPLIREMLIYGWTIFFASVASMAIKLFDAVILGQFVELALVGIYGIAAFIPTFIEAPAYSLERIAAARISHAWERNDLDNIRDIYYKSARYLFLLGGLLFLLVTVNAPFLFRWLPPDYMAGIPVVLILSLSALFNLATGSNTTIIFSSKRFTAGAIALTSVAVLNLVLLYTLIPLLGIEGAAWATCIASFMYNAFKYIYIWRFTRLQPFDRRTFFIVLAIAATYMAARLLPHTGNSTADIVLHTVVIMTVYGLATWFSRVADDLKETLPFFRR